MTNSITNLPIRPAYSNIARPYALAAFQYAKEKEALSLWKTFLEQASLIAADSEVQSLLVNPDISAESWIQFFTRLLFDKLDQAKKHFLSLLSHNKRLMALPEIAALFLHYYNNEEKKVLVKVTTALPLDHDLEAAFVEALIKRTHKNVSLQCEVDPCIIGGAIIHIDDKVIDASLRGKLNRLLAYSLR